MSLRLQPPPPVNLMTKHIPRHSAAIVALILLAAALVRLAAPETRPMHADEAVQTYIFAGLLEQGDYRYNPEHYHGPLPHFINLPLMRAFGIRTLDTLQAWEFRLQPALLGVLLAGLAVLCARGAGCGWRAAVLAGFSPLLVYYGRMAIHETLLACMALAAPLAAERWLARRRMGWLLALGLALGCLHATKETWSIIAFSWAAAALAFGPRKILHALRETGAARIALVAAVALATSFLLYSDFGRHPGGFADAWSTQFSYRTGGGHDRPWYYYALEIMGFYPALGWLRGEGVITLFALAACAALRHRHGGYVARELRIPALPLFLALSAAVQIAVYSIIKYKMPWLMVVPAASLAPLAAHGWKRLCAGRSWNVRAACSLACAAFVLAGGAAQAWSSAFTRAADPDLPLAYVPTLDEADAALTRAVAALPSDAPVAVIGDNYWPLPWYLRAHRGRTGYFSDAEAPAPEELRQFALVLHAGYQIDPVPAEVAARSSVHELRPGYFVRITRNNRQEKERAGVDDPPAAQRGEAAAERE